MEKDGKIRVAILMTVHNRRENTLKCLAHLEDLVYDKYRIRLDVYITDDGSTDGTSEAIRNAYPHTILLAGDGSLYWNRGMLYSWTEAARRDYDYYWWVNDDTFVFPDCLARLLECSGKHQDKAITVGSTCSSRERDRITYVGWKEGKLITELTAEQNCDSMNGNLVLIPRQVFESLGMNDPYYHHSLGDFDYSLRACKAGIGVIVIPGIAGVCDLHEQVTPWMDPTRPFRERFRHFFSPVGNNPFEFFHFKKRHYGWGAAITSFITNFLHLLFPGIWIKKAKNHSI